MYAKAIKNNIQEIKSVTDKMMTIDRGAILQVNSTNEVGQLKAQINNLYSTLLESIDDLEIKNLTKKLQNLEKTNPELYQEILVTSDLSSLLSEDEKDQNYTENVKLVKAMQDWEKLIA